MSLGDALNKFLKGKKKEYHSPDVTFLDEKVSNVTHTLPISVSPPTQRIIIKHGEDFLVFTSKDQIPPEIRDELDHLDDDETIERSVSIFIDGKRETYASLEEVPEHIRRSIAEQSDVE